MAVAAALLALCWLLTGFVLRIAIQLRRYGDTGVRANAGPPLTPVWWVRVLFTTSTVVVATAPLLVLGNVVTTVEALDHDRSAAIGSVVAAFGIATMFWAQLAMGGSWRIGVDVGERTALVTDGPFGLVRNPIFTAMTGTAVGLTLATPTVVGLVGLGVLVLSVEVQVRAVEEPYLRTAHCEPYALYARRTGRFLPRIGRVR